MDRYAKKNIVYKKEIRNMNIFPNFEKIFLY